MAYCEQCGKKIPDGEHLCRDCRSGRDPKKPKGSLLNRLAPVFAILLIAAAVGAAVVSLGGGDNEEESSDETVLTGETTSVSAEDADEANEKEETGEDGDLTAVETEETTKEVVHTYEIVAADLSWSEAKAAAEEAGGHLATITTEEEYETICSMADVAYAADGIKYLWLGAQCDDPAEWSGTECWITGEEWTFEIWYEGEPSGEDTDGTLESCLCMWKVGDGDWTFNDQRDNLVEEFPIVSGNIGYVIEYEE